MSPAKEATQIVKENDDDGVKSDTERPNEEATEDTEETPKEEKVPFKETLLFKALAGPLTLDTLTVVQDLISKGADVNAKGMFQETYLHVLVAPRDEKDGVVKEEPDNLKTENQAQEKKPTSNENQTEDQPQDKVEQQKDKKVEMSARIVTSLVYQLAAAGLKLNTKDQEGNTALHIAAINDQPPSVVIAMIRLGLDPCLLNLSDEDALDMADTAATRTALSYYEPGIWRTVVENNIPKFKTLVDGWCKTDITSVEDEEENLLTLATEKDHFDIVAIIKANQRTNKLIHAALSGDADTVKNMVKEDGVNLNVIDQGYFTIDGSQHQMPLLGEVMLLGRYDCAKHLVKKGADVNFIIEVDKNNKEPLYYYLLKQFDPVPVDIFKVILKKADFSLLKKEHFSLLCYAWAKKLDSQLVSIMVSRGVSLGVRDELGYTLRDIIVRETCAEEEAERHQALYFVDEHIIDMAMEGRLDELKALATSGYGYILITNRKGKTINKIAKKEKKSDVLKFLEDLPKQKKTGYKVHGAIQKGNLAEVRDNMEESVAESCDGVGRSPLHLAVLYERRFIIKWLLKQYPNCVNATDQQGRTALHYAYMIPEGQDIIELLQQAKCNQEIRDNKGQLPSDYKSNNEKTTLETERVRPCGIDTLSLDRYLNLRDSIRSENSDRSLDIIEGIVEFPVGEMMEVSARFPQLTYQDLLFLCVKHKQEDTAIAIIKAGMPYHHTDEVEMSDGKKEAMGLRDAAADKGCDKLVKFLDEYKPPTNDNDGREAKMAFQAAMAVAGSRDNNTPDSDVTLPDNRPDTSEQPTDTSDVKNSSSCVIL